MNSQPTKLQASEEDVGRRLDQFLTSALTDVSRARVQVLIEQNKIEVNGKSERSSYRLRGDEEILVLGPAQAPPLKATPEDIPLDVVYEDDSLAVVNKPSGMMVHAGAGQSSEDEEEGDPRTRGTLVNALLHRFNKLSASGGELRPGIVHRLDKDTSGLILVAKTDSAHRKLAEQFSSRIVKKKYIALVHGSPKSESGTINAPIGRDRARRNRMSTKSADGRDAVSHYKVLKTLTTPYGKFALVEVRIETGRTHQIRVHLASLGHPVVGDHLYGSPHEILPQHSMSRAKQTNTKATRDRAASELARQLTQAATGELSKKSAKTQKSTATSKITALEKLTLNRNFLHAAEVEFVHPRTGKSMQFKSELPQDLSSFLDGLAHLN